MERSQLNKEVVYLPGLNGIRAIAALAVVFSHSTLALGQIGLSSEIFGTYPDGSPRGLELAGFGVSMFFSLSGFLITFLLLKEGEKGSIDIRKFYVRRVLRIWPLYYLYLVLAVVLTLAFSQWNSGNMIYFYLFLGANIPSALGTTIPLLSHYWSLGVEEQFYLFWPWLNRVKRRYFTVILLISFGFFMGLKLAVHLLNPQGFLYDFLIVTRFQCMILGAAFAWIYYRRFGFVRWFQSPVSQLISWLVILVVAFNRFHLASILDHEIISFITGVLILGQIERKGLVNLESRIPDFIGKISFGIYVYHPAVIFVFLLIISPFSEDEWYNYLLFYTVVIMLTITISWLSYRLFESKFLALKKRLYTVVASRSSYR